MAAMIGRWLGPSRVTTSLPSSLTAWISAPSRAPICSDDWQIFRDITLLLGGNPALKDFNSALDILTAMSTEYGALNGVSWGSIGDGGQPILETGVTIPVVEREKNQGR